MTTERLEFPGAGGDVLSARLDLPADGVARGYALFAHCFTGSEDLQAEVNITRALNREGLAVFRVDLTGLGEGARTTSSSHAADLVAAAEFLTRERVAPELLVGHSLGGAAVLQAAAHIPSARAVATIGAPYDEEKMREAIRELDRALLVLHSPLDATVAIESAALIFQAARHPKSFVSLDHADHLLTDERDSQYVGTVLAAWATRYLPAPEEATVERLIAEGDQVVVRTDRSRFRTEVRARSHGFVADEPAALGGTDLGPTPYDYLLGALGTCTSITLRMYADRKGWPLEEAVVRLRQERVHGLDAAECPERPPRTDRIEREVVLRGDLTPEQRQRLMEIADRCPVHQTLEAGVRTETRPGA